MDFIDSNERFIVSVLKSNASSFVRNLLEEQVRIAIDRHLRKEEREDVRQTHAILSAIYAGAIVSCGVWWIMLKDRPEKEQVIQQFTAFIEKL